jgi:hypothetical protein
MAAGVSKRLWEIGGIVVDVLRLGRRAMPKNRFGDDRAENALVSTTKREGDRRPGLGAAMIEFITERSGQKLKRTVTIDTEDIIVFFAGLIALSFSVSMIVGWVPINGWTIGVIGLSGVSPGVAKIIKARNPKKALKRKQ